MSIKLPVIYNQLLDQNKDILLGFNTEKSYNIYNYGCLLTQLAQGACYYGHTVTPVELNEKLKALGDNVAFVNGGVYVWGALSKIYPDVLEVRTVTPTLLTDEQVGTIREAIDNGYPVIVQIDYNPKTVENDMHFVTIVGYNKNDENDFTITDPLGGRTVSLKQYLAWFKPSARRTIEQFIILKGPVPQQTMEPIAQPVSEPVNATPIATGVTVDPQQNDLNIKMASQYKDVVSYLEIAKPPEETLYEDVKRVIAGYKSRATDLENKKVTAEKKVGELNIIIETKDREISTLKEQLITAQKLHKEEIDALKSMTPNVDRLKAQYESIVRERDNNILELQEELKKLKIAKSDEEVEAAHTAETKKITVTYHKGFFEELISSINSFFTDVKWPKR